MATPDEQVYAVSLEAAGSSPEAVPTGPDLFSGTIHHLASQRF